MGIRGASMTQVFQTVPSVTCTILFPQNRISQIQELQITTNPNIHAYEVDGTFDECQSIVKEALNDFQLPKMSTVNSINIGRIIAQICYYFYIYTQFPNTNTIVIPSGNAGNLFACCIAKRIGTTYTKNYRSV